MVPWRGRCKVWLSPIRRRADAYPRPRPDLQRARTSRRQSVGARDMQSLQPPHNRRQCRQDSITRMCPPPRGLTVFSPHLGGHIMAVEVLGSASPEIRRGISVHCFRDQRASGRGPAGSGIASAGEGSVGPSRRVQENRRVRRCRASKRQNEPPVFRHTSPRLITRPG